MVKLKPLWTLLKLLLLIVLLAGIFAAIWLRQGPKSLDWAKPYILNSLNSADATYRIDTGSMVIDWRDLSKLGLVRVQKVRVTGNDGAVFASLPELYVSLDPLGFLPQRRLLNTIIVQEPKFFLTRDKDKNLRLGLQGNDQSMTPMAQLSGEPKKSMGWNGRLPFRHLMIERMSFVISDEATQKRLVATDASIELRRRFGYYTGYVDLPFTYGKQKGSVRSTIRSVERGKHLIETTLDAVPTDYACMLAACPGGLDLSGMVGGEVTLAFDDRLKAYGGHAALTTDKLTVTAPEWFPEPLEMRSSSVEVKATDGMKKVELVKMELDLEDTYLTGTASAEKKADGWYAQGKGGTDKLDIQKLYKYWPLILAPDSREWVMSSLVAGMGEDSVVNFKLTPKDFAAPEISDEAIEATVKARGVTVHYIPGFPEMKQVNGLVTFTGTTIMVDATSGSLLTGTTISKAHIAFPDLNKAGTPMEIRTTLNAPARDAATLLQLEHFGFDDALELNPATIKGTVTGTLNLKFDAFSADKPGAAPAGDGQVSFDDVGYDIDLNLSDIAQPKFAGLFDISGASGKLAANNDGMAFDGAVKLSASNEVKVKVSQKSGGDAKLLIDGGVSRDEFAALGLPDDRRFGEGTVKMLADITAMKNDILLNSAKIDLSDMAFSIPEISWQKKRGSAAIIELEPSGKSYKLNVKAPGLSVPNATLTLTSGMDVQQLTLPRVKTDSSDFGLRYSQTAKGIVVKLTGNTLDASMSYAGEGDEGAENSLLANFPALDLTIDLGALILVPSDPLTNVKGTLVCSKARCESANITAHAGKSDIASTIIQAQGVRTFLLTATSTGDFLRALDITDRMYGGTMKLQGTYDDSVTPPALPAHLSIRSFTLRNSQILGRILSIGSLTGLSNALTGSGIAFKELSGDIRSQGGVIKLKNGKAQGNALGIGIGGTIDTNKSTLNLNGTLVPAAALNTIFSNIPLLGAIAGGDNGLIAFNFSVKGPQSDPSVMVNPFSGLTPGFLRGIWGSNNPSDDADDKPATDSDEVPARRHQRGIGQ